MVAVPVGVEHEANRFRAQRPDGSYDLVGKRRILIIDQEDAVVPHRYRHVAAASRQHVDAGAEIGGMDLYGLPVLGPEHGGGRDDERTGHEHRAHLSAKPHESLPVAR